MFEENEVDIDTEEETPENDEFENKDSEEISEESEKGEYDYEAELEAERKRREKAESSAQHHREEAEKLRKEREGFVTKDDLKELEANLTRKTFRSQVESEVAKIARTPKEAELILYHYENSLVPTGDVSTDIRRARLMANEKRLVAENEELEAALRSKETRGQGVSGGRRMEDEAKEPQLDPDTRKLISLNRMTWDSKSKRFKNDKGVAYDPKTGAVADPRRK